MARIGIIGGSGLDNPNLFQNAKEIDLKSEWGEPSAPPVMGTIGEQEVVILSRHGKAHTVPPSEVNYRAHIDLFAQLEVDAILATTATGSLREEIGRGDLIFPDQFIDHTYRRSNTFYHRFDPDAPKHTPMADPFNADLRERLIASAQLLGLPFHSKGTLITVEGPRFSTRAESNMFRLWGADIINMSVATECALANEAGIPYAAVALATDYDCWKEDEEAVSHEAVLAVFEENVEHVIQLLVHCLKNWG